MNPSRFNYNVYGLHSTACVWTELCYIPNSPAPISIFGWTVRTPYPPYTGLSKPSEVFISYLADLALAENMKKGVDYTRT